MTTTWASPSVTLSSRRSDHAPEAVRAGKVRPGAGRGVALPGFGQRSRQQRLPRPPLGPQPEVRLPSDGSRAASRPPRVATPVSFFCKNEYSVYTLFYNHARRLFACLALDATEIAR